MSITSRIASAWNAFARRENEPSQYASTGYSTTARATTPRLRYQTERSIISSIYTRIAIDVAGVQIKHAKIDEQERFMKKADSDLNRCLTWEPNLDQGPRQFRQDIALTLFGAGVAAIVPIDTDIDPRLGRPYDIRSVRVGKVVSWHPSNVRVSVWNEKTGLEQEVSLEKNTVGIVENPLYAVMNEPSSTLQRLQRKLALLDSVDEASSSGKLDLIIQLPYTVRSDAMRQRAEKRREDIEFQLKGSQYGIAYTDGTEKVIQLNRPAENNLLTQIKHLEEKLYSELGITADVMNGTADEPTMINYYNRTIEPILDAITEAMQRSFLVNGYEDGERIMYFRDPFKLLPLSEIAEIADKFTRNEILSSNEIRQRVGVSPSSDPKADKLVNSNMPQGDTGVPPPPYEPQYKPPREKSRRNASTEANVD